MPTPDEIIDVLTGLDPLADLPRTGWLLRGVADPESIADHSFGVAVVVMLLVDALRSGGRTVDGERALRMALVHDAAEARTGDVPMPNKTPELGAALERLESDLVRGLLPDGYPELWHEVENGDSLEARIVKAADKIQMMVKVWLYERKRGANLDEFWSNPKNFRSMDLPIADEIYAALCRRAGRTRPTGGE